MAQNTESAPTIEEAEKAKREGATCMALGAGVGVLGAASAALTGALCPLCVFIAPGLIGVGAYRRWRGSAQSDKSESKEESFGREK